MRKMNRAFFYAACMGAFLAVSASCPAQGAWRVDFDGNAARGEPVEVGGAVPGAPVMQGVGRKVNVPAPAEVVSSGSVEKEFSRALNEQIKKYPTGREILEKFKTPPLVTFGKLNYNFRHVDAAVEHRLSAEGSEIVFNTQSLGAMIKETDPEAAKTDLTDPANLRRYLSTHPGAINTLVDVFDAVYVQELTHDIQYQRQGEGFLDWIELNDGKLPIEHKWEASWMQNRYFHEKVKSNPAKYLKWPGPHIYEAFDYLNYITDLNKYKREKRLFHSNCTTFDKLKFVPQSEKVYYDEWLRSEEQQWPRLSYEGLILHAKEYSKGKLLILAPRCLKGAYDRASKNGFLNAKTRAEIGGVFEEVTRKVDPSRVGKPMARELKELSAALGIPLPEKIGAVLKSNK